MSKRHPKSARALAKRPAAPKTLPFEHQPELRALTLYDSLPPGHATFLVTDAPDFRCGSEASEYAVIDQFDREIQHGEVSSYSTTPVVADVVCS
jgi:hypothetical protein